MPSQAERMEKRVREAIVTLESLLGPSQVRGRGTVLAELIKRAEMPHGVDGYPTGSGSERTSGGGTGDPTSQAVMARQQDVCTKCESGMVVLPDKRRVKCRRCGGTGKRWADPVGDAVMEIEARILHVYTSTRSIDRHRQLINSSGVLRGRASSLQGECAACHDMVTGIGEDRLRAGFDNKCYLSFTAWKVRNPDTDGDPGGQYRKFITWRQQSLAERAKKAQD